MQVITTRAEAAAIIRKAHTDGQLAAQAPSPRSAYFIDGGYRCAIGQLFTPEEAHKLEHPGTIGDYLGAHTLIDEGILNVDDPQWFIDAQQLHDNWVFAQTYNTPEALDPNDAEAQFLEHLQ